ncbi:MAG: molybdopterin molybdotransferase MoeA [Thiomargarita sp.]|nr:molybdopterin molybdotransferase MoeA [Thiomargarita sp.]
MPKNHSSQFLTVVEASQRINASVEAISGAEQLAIRDALDRVLATDILSKINVPPHQNSAMDGYAVQSLDLPNAGETKQLKVVATSFAGQVCSQIIQVGECARIFTGAVIPAGTDTVIMQEDVQLQAGVISITGLHQAGQHVRPIGEDLKIAQVVLKAGKLLSPADIGLLASLGIAEVKVKRRLRVAFFSTGDELCPVGENLQTGQIYDSNRYTLHGVLTHLGVDIIDMGIVADKPEAIENAFLAAANCSDVIITSGGVSVGDADYVTDTLERLGTVDFWKVAVKPGKPLTFGYVEQAVFFGLPGNPVSAMVTFYQFVQPALKRMMGQTAILPIRFKVPAIMPLKKKAGRLEFQRGILEKDENEQLVVKSTGRQGSGVLSSMSQANCLIILSRECTQVEVGEQVLVEPFYGLFG